MSLFTLVVIFSLELGVSPELAQLSAMGVYITMNVECQVPSLFSFSNKQGQLLTTEEPVLR